jgi:hypothetical protein
MTIREIIKFKDIETYRKLQAIKYSKPKNKIKLGDKPESLMKADSYKRDKGVIKQKSWGK